MGQSEATMEHVDTTIETICDWIQQRLNDERNKDLLPGMTSALANLITARANATTHKFKN